MGRYREDLSKDQWINHFDNLIKHLVNKPKTKAKLKQNFSQLINSKSSPKKSRLALAKLNEMKLELGVDWTKWRARITQREKGKLDNDIRIPENTLAQYNKFIGSHSLTIEQLIIQLPQLLKKKGIYNLTALTQHSVKSSQLKRRVIKKKVTT